MSNFKEEKLEKLNTIEMLRNSMCGYEVEYLISDCIVDSENEDEFNEYLDDYIWELGILIEQIERFINKLEDLYF